MNPVSALIFGILALALAGPIPALLSRATWTHRAPRAALVLWQAVALAAVLSAFSAGIAIASRLLVPGPDGRPTTAPLDEIDVLGWPLWALYVGVLAATLIIGARLIFAVTRVGFHTRRRRARHRMLVDLLDCSPDLAHRPSSAALRVLSSPRPLAYCLPGLRRRIVMSEGVLDTLDDAEIRAVLTHERAHLRARHDLVLEAFTAVYAAFPRFVRSGSALDSVQLLVEMLADDSARRTAGPTPLARALVACAGAEAPAGALALGGPGTLVRVTRLHRGNDRRLAALVYFTAAAVLVVPTLAVAIPWLTELHKLMGPLSPLN
ncbi:M56 family metallopeptidase [Tomitella cavernea]|uniref:M56 family metallopeptidase n=1 Tax=Tomitella cavernea TaxID=1387982 RepID=A0ABP9CNS1_9ACTN|nr:M56 family metallopeptidase [Tomitella cavernea]